MGTICLHFVCSPLFSFSSPLLSSPPLSSPLSSLTACDLVSLGSVDVPGPGSDALLAQAVQQIKSLELSTMNIVTFKASKEGIALTENINGWVRGIVSNHYFKLWMGSDQERNVNHEPYIVTFKAAKACVPVTLTDNIHVCVCVWGGGVMGWENELC